MGQILVTFDLETNGFKNCSVLSIYAMKLLVDLENNTMEKIGEFERYYYRNQGETLNPGAIQVNGLTDDVISGKRAETGNNYPLMFDNDQQSFVDFHNDADVVISHNTNFDLSFLKVKPKATWCSMKNAPRELSMHKDPKLNELATYLKVPWENSNLHGAKYDVEILSRCIYRLFKKREERFMKMLQNK